MDFPFHLNKFFIFCFPRNDIILSHTISCRLHTSYTRSPYKIYHFPFIYHTLDYLIYLYFHSWLCICFFLFVAFLLLILCLRFAKGRIKVYLLTCTRNNSNTTAVRLWKQVVVYNISNLKTMNIKLNSDIKLFNIYTGIIPQLFL